MEKKKEARSIQLACSTAPEGYTRWTLNLLAGKLVDLEVVESISGQMVMRTLEKMNLDYCYFQLRSHGILWR
uniref:Winged helix-turn helix n=1 Tax=Candidatus Kentrum sp. SD TaxID=2126332 RepID=A0A451BK20_9GAMM|nr:MAG: Winged helix-turn helix [Candidatus Kentron sp. SD]